jgi:hypothetical protein
MNLRAILELPSDAPNRVCRFEPFGPAHREQMIREVLGLANAEMEGDRYIVFGAHHDGATMNIVGLTEADTNTLENDVASIGQLVEPDLETTASYEAIDDKQVAVLQLTHCQNPPYVVRETVSERLQRGECWIRKDGKIGLALRSDLDRMYGKIQPVESPSVLVGFNGHADCQTLEVEIPDRSDPPSKRASAELKQEMESQPASSETSIARARVVEARMYATESALSQADNTIKLNIAAEELRKRADIYYFFEERAIKLNMSILNKTRLAFQGARLELTFPRTSDFDIANQLFPAPDEKSSALHSELMGYPDVEKTKASILVRAEVGDVEPEREIEAFESAIRLAVGAGWRGKKMGIHYVLSAENLKKPFKGRLKIRFGH